MRYRPEVEITTALMDNGGLVLLSERSGKLYRCNSTAAKMWTALHQHGGRPEAAADAVAAQYGTEPARVRADLKALVDELRRAGLVKAEP